ncbi:MAG TPA: transketolase [Rhizomicrobium sp.]|jgi:transketolase|nr:transketolase [Rhizomicrobium sp.]
MNDRSKTSVSPENNRENVEIRRLANAIRGLTLDAVQKAKSGHPGLPLGMADVATVLFSQFLKYDPAHPDWEDRDRFVLSAGHGSMLLYSLLYLTGYPGMTLDDIKTFRQLGSPCAGHPEHGHAPGIETTTGPLGQGIANAVGMAIAERHLNTRFGDDLVQHKTYALCSDGDLMEGISHEAIGLAGHLKLSNLIFLYDDNHITIDGDKALSDTSDANMRFAAMGWRVDNCDGHDARDVTRALNEAQHSDRPVMINCRTIIGFGMPTKAGTQKAHSDAPGEEELAGAKKALDLPPEPFALNDGVLEAWRKIGKQGASKFAEWETRRKAAKPDVAKAHADAHKGAVPEALAPKLAEYKKKVAAEKPSIATRKASGAVLAIINPLMPSTIGGSADLTPSNDTKTDDIANFEPGNYSGRYMRYGIREHAMVAAMSGMALHGGVVPYGGTFLVFSDYCRPSIRLAALMGSHAIYVFTHDSIGVGEDGPTHQPVEHLAALRAIPNLHVFRPADGIETAECWEIALNRKEGPCLFALTRQNVATSRTTHIDENLTARGAYEIAPAEGDAKVTFLATGSEVELAMKARELLKADGIGARVVSMPCWELFEEQPATYRDAILGPGTVKVGIEAAVRQGWDRYIGADGAFIGMHSFGASAPYKDAYKHFNITPEAAADAARTALKAKH